MIKDNRIDAFIKVIGFEMDEESGFYLPKDMVVEPRQQFAFTNFSANSTASSAQPKHGLTFESLSNTLETINKQKQEFYDNYKHVPEKDIGDEVAEWLEAMQE